MGFWTAASGMKALHCTLVFLGSVFVVFLRVSVVFLKADRVNDDVARGGWVEVYVDVYRDRSQKRAGEFRTLRNTAML